MRIVHCVPSMKTIAAWQLRLEQEVRIVKCQVPAPLVLDPLVDVLVRVRAAALNPIDRYRVEEASADRSLIGQFTLGFDFSGVVDQECGNFQAGDEVFGCVHPAGRIVNQQGSLQEIVIVSNRQCIYKPDSLTMVEAASLGVVASTAYQALSAVDLQPGDSVLITGGAGGVGTMAIQIAKEVFKAGSIWVTVTSRHQEDVCRELGANHVILVPQHDISKVVTTLPESLRLALDCTGEAIELNAMKEQQGLTKLTIVTISVSEDLLPSGVIPVTALTGDQRSFQALLPYLVKRTIRPVIDKVFSFDEVLDAFRYLSAGHPIGKVAIQF